jgi:hypothetical protein
MRNEARVFPETTRYQWEGATKWTFQQAERHIKAGLTGAKDTPRWRSFKQVLDALYILADERGVSAFKGDKLKALLIAAAHDNKWYSRSNNNLPAVNAPEGHKVCRRCHTPKPLELFRCVASAAQKERNGWNSNAQYFTISLLCDKCRPIKQKESKAAENRKATKNSPVSIIDIYRKGITQAIGAVVSVMRAHTHDINGYKDVRFTNPEDRKYYETRLEYLRLARQRLNDRIDEGSLTRYGEGETPPTGAWHELLTAEEREWLATRHSQGSWATVGAVRGGKVPRLWDVPSNERPTMPRSKFTVPKVEVPASVIVPVPPRPVLPSAEEWANTPWEDM